MTTVLMLVGPDYEDLEVWYPKLRLEAAGVRVPLVGMGERTYAGKHGYPCAVDGDVADWSADQIEGLIAPGGWAPDKLRRDPKILALVRALDAQQKLLGTICHGPWVFVSAGVVKGRKLTSTVGIKDDVVNAGATWVDEPVVVDGHFVSARVPKDLPAFGEALVDAVKSIRR